MYSLAQGFKDCLIFFYCWLFWNRLSDRFGGSIAFWEYALAFLISRPTSSCSHWWEFVCSECRHDVILHVSIAPFKRTMQHHIFCYFVLNLLDNTIPNDNITHDIIALLKTSGDYYFFPDTRIVSGMCHFVDRRKVIAQVTRFRLYHCLGDSTLHSGTLHLNTVINELLSSN